MDNNDKQDTEMAVTEPTAPHAPVAPQAPVAAVNRMEEALSAVEYVEPSPLEVLTVNLATKPPGYSSAQALQALEDGDAEEALAICDSADSSLGDSVMPLSLQLIRGRALLALERADEAAEEFHKLLRLDPECPAALKGLGDTYFVQNKEVIAFTYYERALELSGNYQALAERVCFTVILPEEISNTMPAVEITVSDTTISDETVSETANPETSGADVDIAETEPAEIAVPEDASVEVVGPNNAAPADEANEPTIATLEEIVVRDAGEDSEDLAFVSNVSLTLKRGREEVVTEITADETVVESVVDTLTELDTGTPEIEEQATVVVPKLEVSLENHSPKPRARKKISPAELTERYDRVQRPAHYQTETMADLLFQQGYADAALDIYRVLVEKNPIQRLQEKLAKAESSPKRSR